MYLSQQQGRNLHPFLSWGFLCCSSKFWLDRGVGCSSISHTGLRSRL